jgi:hypothetical protein
MPDHYMNYLECDVPDGLTLTEWRRRRLAERRLAERPALLPRLRSRRHVTP